MKRLPFSLCVIAVSAASIRLAGCGGASSTALPPVTNSAAMRDLARSYKSLYVFKGVPDGQGPTGELVALNGVLYGSTAYGGHGFGTVFSVTTSGVEHVLHRFTRGPNGNAPNGGLVEVNGEFYGTTYGGGYRCATSYGRTGCGAVFSITASGKERTLYRFKGVPDGFTPAGRMVWLNGKFYGTTIYGGARCSPGPAGCGTVFSVDTQGHERILYRFQGGRDGRGPQAPLLALGGKLYGTTSAGGSANCYDGCGTLFELTTAGVETVLHRFAGGSDSSNPDGGLIAVGGMLYGTTSGSGWSICTGLHTGCGTVFKATTSGAESVIYTFKGTPDAASPNGDLVADHGLLYGTSQSGGKSCGYWDSGTIFAVSTDGAERVAHTFKCKSVLNPDAGLVLLGHTLYGTAFSGYGTVFAFTP